MFNHFLQVPWFNIQKLKNVKRCSFLKNWLEIQNNVLGPLLEYEPTSNPLYWLVLFRALKLTHWTLTKVFFFFFFFFFKQMTNEWLSWWINTVFLLFSQQVKKYWTSLTAHNWQKYIPKMSLPKNSRVQAAGLKKSKYTFKITIFVSMWNLGQFQEKTDILSITT